MTFCRAVAQLTPFHRDDLYWAGLTTLVAHPDHIEVYDRVFSDHFGRGAFEETWRSMFSGVAPPAPAEIEIETALASLTEASQEDDLEDPGAIALRLIASSTEVLRTKSFEALNDEERLHADRMIRRLAPALPLKRSRRLQAAARGAHFDLRHTLRSSLRTEGEPVTRAWQARRLKRRPLVLLLDISGSMGPYARALLQFGYATATGGRVEVFCFGTRLTRVTRSLRTRDPDRALAEVARRVRDFEGGTRIGAAIKQLLDDYSQASALKGGLVVICSDGLERDDPALLANQMERLHRVAHRIIWVNPLKGGARYEPLQRGMSAALPHVDRFMAGHNLASLEALSEAIL